MADVKGILFAGLIGDLCLFVCPGGLIMFTASERLADGWEGKMDEAIGAVSRQGLWELLEYRWIPYIVNVRRNERAKVPVLRVLKE